ncbi:MAG: FAD-dependent oxidoreductase [Myxococcus sp.]|nr:FAD-dependent oxidoreductase [Myxococcus sp.]
MSPVVIVGAGVSGLACAQALRAAGRPVVVLERARGVGGRCATRRVEGVPLDFGPTFLHGSAPDFLAAVRAASSAPRGGWPTIVEGQGQPCQPDAFTPGEQRFALEEGVVAFPRALAAGLDVRLQQTITRLEPAGEQVLLETAAGEEHQAPVVVLALAAEQSRSLLSTMSAPPPVVRGAAALLGLSRSQTCLALLAVYPEGTPAPPWQICYPRSSRVLQLVSHETSKRPAGGRVALVLQGRPAWSRAHLDDPAWSDALLAEAGEVVGPWAATPMARSAHRWLYARSDRSSELVAPLLLELPGGAQVGVCGDRFAPGGGVEAAWHSGRALAARIISQAMETT